MIPQIGFAEMMVLVILAIIVVGPKDLPKLMRSIGQFMAKMRALGNEFKQAFDDMGAEDEIAAMRREIEELKKLGDLDPEIKADLANEMRSLDTDIRSASDISSPKTPDPKPSVSHDVGSPAMNPDPLPKKGKSDE